MILKLPLFRFAVIITLSIFFVNDSISQGISIDEDPAIGELMEKYTDWNKEEKTIQGWRIQIINTDDRRKMERILSQFRYRFPEVDYVSWKQLSPYYKIKVGSYDSKLAVLAFLQKVKEYFPSAIPVIEDISKRELLGL